MKTKLLFSLLAIFLLVGCAGTWTKPGANQQEFNRDKLACKKQAREAMRSVQRMGAPGAAAAEYDNTFASCMKSRGWKKK